MAMSKFEKAFADARDRGDLKFDFNGKIYTTERKDDPPRRTKYSSTADTAKFRAERDKPRTKAGQTGTRNFSSSSKSSDSKPEDGTRKSLKDLAARTSPRELGRIPQRRMSPSEFKTAGEREQTREGSLANQYRKESKMKDLASTAEIMATMVGGRGAGKVVGEAFEGATLPSLLNEAAATIPGKVVRPRIKTVRGPGKLVSDTEVSGMKAGGKVKKVMGEFKRGSLKSSSGQKVTNPKQAVAIAMSEAGKKMKKMAVGGMAGEKEAKGMKRGGTACMARGGGIERRGSGAGTVIKMKSGGVVDGIAQHGKTNCKIC